MSAHPTPGEILYSILKTGWSSVNLPSTFPMGSDVSRVPKTTGRPTKLSPVQYVQPRLSIYTFIHLIPYSNSELLMKYTTSLSIHDSWRAFRSTILEYPRESASSQGRSCSEIMVIINNRDSSDPVALTYYVHTYQPHKN